MNVVQGVKTVLKVLFSKVLSNKLSTLIGGATAATGVAAVIDPSVLELIPENLRGYAVLLVVIVLCARSLKDEIKDIIKAYRETNRS